MKIVLAAVDESPTARDVLQSALVVGELTGATVEAVHVRVDESVPYHGTSPTSSGCALRVLDGAVGDRLAEALAADDVVAGVLGARH